MAKVWKNLGFVFHLQVKLQNFKCNLLGEQLTSLFWKLFGFFHLNLKHYKTEDLAGLEWKSYGMS